MAGDKKKTEKQKSEGAEDQKKAEAKPEAEETPKDSKENTESKEEKKSEVKVSAKLEKVIGEIEKLTVLELADLVKALEDKFGVSAAAMPMAAGVPTGGAAEAGDESTQDEQTTFNVVLADAGSNKISVIKAVRELNQSLGLKDAKDLVEAAPKPVLEGVKKEEAEEAKKKLEEAGAKVELK